MATKRMPAAVRPSSHFALIKCTAAWVVGVRRRLGRQRSSHQLSGTESQRPTHASDAPDRPRTPKLQPFVCVLRVKPPHDGRKTTLCDTHGGCCEWERGLPRVQPPQHPACSETRAVPFSTPTTSTLRTTRDAWCKVKSMASTPLIWKWGWAELRCSYYFASDFSRGRCSN